MPIETFMTKDTPEARILTQEQEQIEELQEKVKHLEDKLRKHKSDIYVHLRTPCVVIDLTPTLYDKEEAE